MNEWCFIELELGSKHRLSHKTDHCRQNFHVSNANTSWCGKQPPFFSFKLNIALLVLEGKVIWTSSDLETKMEILSKKKLF